jgi:hypothetical protein
MRRRYSAHQPKSLSYSNIVASLALFVALGGASYAAVAIPPESIGTKQLRSGSVTPKVLAFPLGASSVTNDQPEDLPKTPCDEPPLPGTPLLVDCPQPRQVGISTPGSEVHLRMQAAGNVVATALVDLRNEGPPNTSATVTLSFIVDHRRATSSILTIAGGASMREPMQMFFHRPGGRHTVGVSAEAHYSSRSGGNVIVAGISVITSTFPV